MYIDAIELEIKYRKSASRSGIPLNFIQLSKFRTNLDAIKTSVCCQSSDYILFCSILLPNYI